MKKLLMLSIIVCPLFSLSQNLHVNLFGGLSNYQGDLIGQQINLGQSRGAFGVGLTYDLTNHFSLRTGIITGSIGADDKNNSGSVQGRNLNFKSRIFEGNLVAEYNLFDLRDRKFTPYVFAGLGVYHFNPYTYDTTGNRFYLQPLSTEGQGLSQYPDRNTYNLTQLAIPFGGGLKLRISDNVSIGYEIGFRKLFTDYLDDVSTTYADQAILLNAKGPKAVELAYRGGELKNGDPVYPAEGAIRGGAKQKDWYYFQGITISIALPGKNSVGWGGRGGRMGCPVKVL